MVFTKFDEFQRRIRLEIVTGNPGAADEVDALVKREVDERLKKNCLNLLSKVTGTDTYPYAVVSGKILLTTPSYAQPKLTVNAPHGERVQKLIQVTQELLEVKFGPLANNSAALAGSIAQRVNPDIKIESSIECV